MILYLSRIKRTITQMENYRNEYVSKCNKKFKIFKDKNKGCFDGFDSVLDIKKKGMMSMILSFI